MTNKEKHAIYTQTDLLTGCLDKSSTEETIKCIMKNSFQLDEHILILVDIDNFKALNYTHGFSTGDMVLRNLGNRLQKTIRGGDIVGRMGSDNFVIFLRNVNNLISLTQKVEEIAFVFRESFLTENKSYKISYSIGISRFKQSEDISYNLLFDQANTARLVAKSKGKNQYCIYTDTIAYQMRSQIFTTENTIIENKKGLERNILFKVFQLLQSKNDISTAINDILELLGKELNVSRSYIFELTDDGQNYCNTYEWCAPNILSTFDDLQKVPLSEYEQVFSLLDEDGILACEDTSAFGGNYSDLHQAQGVKSFLQVVVKDGDISRLMLGVDECNRTRRWTERESTAIMYLSNLLGMLSQQLENNNLSLGFDQLKSLVTKDKLTGISTKEKFYSDTKELLKNKSDKKYFFFLLNVNKFQMINSFFGMDEGDKLLKAIAKEFERYSKENSSACGRVGADIFCGSQSFDSPLETVLDKIIERINICIKNYNPNYNLTISIGVYEIKNTHTSMEVMYSKANMAIKKIKKLQVTAYSIYEDGMEAEEISEQSIINDIYPALFEKQFEVYLQPKISLKSGAIVGAEALVRWNHPIKGFMSPAEFIPIFEKNGLITKVDYFVWETVFAFAKENIENHTLFLPISVNISRVDLFNISIVSCFKELLAKYDIDPKYIHIEITESAYIENYEEILAVIKKLNQLGFHIEMDDFGTGYSSLNMFNDMIVDTIKLDMKFVQNLQLNGDKRNILSFIISLAKHFDLPVVAEGIETEEQMLFLKNIGCDIGQGFYFAKPMPIPQFLDYLKEKEAETTVSLKTDSFQEIPLADILYPSQQLLSFFNIALGDIGILDVKKDIIKLIRCNDEYYEMLGIQNHKELFKDRINEIFHKEDMPLIFSKITEAKNTKSTTSCDVRVLDFSKEDRYENTNLQSINIRFKLINSNINSDIYLATIFNL